MTSDPTAVAGLLPAAVAALSDDANNVHAALPFANAVTASALAGGVLSLTIHDPSKAGLGNFARADAQLGRVIADAVASIANFTYTSIAYVDG